MLNLFKFTFPSVVLMILLYFTVTQGARWDYNTSGNFGPSHWAPSYPSCRGKHQSPIAFFQQDVELDPDLAELNLTSYNQEIGKKKLILHNNGHALQVDIPDGVNVTIEGGNLPDWYKLVQFHFHWGEYDFQGSEHMVGDTMYPLILHLVHVRRGKRMEFNFDDQEELAVVAVGFHLSETPNPELQKIVKHLHEVDYQDEENPIEEVIQLSGLLPEDQTNFFRYHGSLTTPPCWESVVWSVLVNTINVSVGQLHEFRRIYSTYRHQSTPMHMRGNFRPVQALNDRKVTVRMAVEDLPERAGLKIVNGAAWRPAISLLFATIMMLATGALVAMAMGARLWG